MANTETVRYILPQEQLVLYDSHAGRHGLTKGERVIGFPGSILPEGLIAVDWRVTNKNTFQLTGGGHGFITREAHRKAAAAIDRARLTKTGDPYRLGYAAMILATLAIAQKEGTTNIEGNPWPNRLRKNIRRALGNKRIPTQVKEGILGYYKVAQSIYQDKISV